MPVSTVTALPLAGGGGCGTTRVWRDLVGSHTAQAGLGQCRNCSPPEFTVLPWGIPPTSTDSSQRSIISSSYVASVKSRDTENYISCSRLFDEVPALRRALGKSVFSHCPFREQLTNAGVGLGSPVTETALNATSKEPELLKEEGSYIQADGTAVNYRSC